MKTHALTASLILALLTACGGRSSSPPDLPSDKPAEDKPNTPSSPSTVTLNLSDIVLPPNTVERPVPDEQKQIDEALKLTNELRAEKGLQPLRYNESLAAYATQRAKELVTLNAHKRPNGDNPLDNRYLPGNGLVGENIAAGKAEAAEKARMEYEERVQAAKEAEQQEMEEKEQRWRDDLELIIAELEDEENQLERELEDELHRAEMK